MPYHDRRSCKDSRLILESSRCIVLQVVTVFVWMVAMDLEGPSLLVCNSFLLPQSPCLPGLQCRVYSSNRTLLDLWTLLDSLLYRFNVQPLLYLLTDAQKAHYDSMLVKCTCHGSTYEIVRRKMLRALVEFRIRGVKTNIPFLASLPTHPTFIDGNCWTTFIDDTPELFDLVGSQNRAQKLLSYLGDVAVNGEHQGPNRRAEIQRRYHYARII